MQHANTYFDVLIQNQNHRKYRKCKNVQNPDINKAILDKAMITQEQLIKYNFVAPLANGNFETKWKCYHGISNKTIFR